MSNELMIVANQAGLAEEKTKYLLASFGKQFEQAGQIANGAKDIIVTDESQEDLMLEARKRRLALRAVRVEVENTRKELKEQSLREGKAIDGLANVIKALVIPVEEHLQQQEDFKKIREEQRIQALREQRFAELQKYEFYADGLDLGTMSEETYTTLLNNTKTAYEARIAEQKRIEQERLEAEQRRLAEEKRLREENEKLQKEAALRAAEEEKKLAAERAKLDAERKAREAAEAKLRAEREKRERELAAEKAKAEAEKRVAEEAERQKLLAPDKVKLIELATTIEKLQLPAVQSKEASAALRASEEMLARVSTFIREKARTL